MQQTGLKEKEQDSKVFCVNCLTNPAEPGSNRCKDCQEQIDVFSRDMVFAGQRPKCNNGLV